MIKSSITLSSVYFRKGFEGYKRRIEVAQLRSLSRRNETIVSWRIQNRGYDDLDDHHSGDKHDIDNGSDFWIRTAD